MNPLSRYVRHEGDPEVLETGPSVRDTSDTLTKGLGWFSIGLGVLELAGEWTFDSFSELARRVRMAFHTLGVEWRAWPPLERRADRRVEIDLVSPALLAEAAEPDADGEEPLPA